MSRKLKKSTRGLFGRFFVRPYEPVQVHGSVHNLARVGGVSILSLPREYAPCDLVVPTRFAATGQFLVDAGTSSIPLKMIEYQPGTTVVVTNVLKKGAGCDVPGLFRIPGQTRTIQALKEHFMSHMYLDDFVSTRESDIEVTIRLACLPSQSALPYNIHDVASTFKYFLGELDGGILGSVEVFESLRKALIPSIKPTYSDLEFRCRGLDEEEQDDFVNAHWVARILCSIECTQRRNLILAVFGILALLKQDPQDSVMGSPLRPTFPLTFTDTLQELQQNLAPINPNASNERMSSKSISLIFAPLLLANLTEHIRIEPILTQSPAMFRRKSIPKSVSMMHLKRFSGNASPLRSKNTSPSKHGHISSPIPYKGETLVDRMKRMGSKREVQQGRELGEGVERNRIAAKMIEICIRNWGYVVDCLREGGFGRENTGMIVGKQSTTASQFSGAGTVG
jgi:hypothetical protein